MCRRPLDLLTMEIDHVVPESLERQPSLLATHLVELGLPLDFPVNSFSNWLPICGSCNRAKSNHVFRPSLLIQGALERAQRNASKAAQVAAEVPTQRQMARALNFVLRGFRGDETDEELLKPLIEKFAQLNPDAWKVLSSSISRARTPPGSGTRSRTIRLSPTFTVVLEPGIVSLRDDGSITSSWALSI